MTTLVQTGRTQVRGGPAHISTQLWCAGDFGAPGPTGKHKGTDGGWQSSLRCCKDGGAGFFRQKLSQRFGHCRQVGRDTHIKKARAGVTHKRAHTHKHTRTSLSCFEVRLSCSMEQMFLCPCLKCSNDFCPSCLTRSLSIPLFPSHACSLSMALAQHGD